MKNVCYYLFFLVFVLSSCDGNETNIPIYGYELGNKNIQTLKLNIYRTSNTIAYKYLHTTDSLKHIQLQYQPKEDVIIIDLDTFKKNKITYNIKKVKYNIYQTKNSKSHKRTLVFNNELGLLASLANGKDVVFLTDSIALNVKEFMFKDLFINLNTLETK